MKKVLALLVVLALVAPAIAQEVVLSSVDNGDGTATIKMNVVSGGPIVGFALNVETTAGTLVDPVTVDSFFDIFIDLAYDEETTGDGYTYAEGTNPVCKTTNTPGAYTVAQANTDGVPFAVCAGGLGGLDPENLASGPAAGDTIDLMVLTADVEATAEITLNVPRGGIVAKDNAALVIKADNIATGGTLDVLELTETPTTSLKVVIGPSGPACWGWASQCYGATDVDDNIVDIDDFLLFKAAFGSSADGTNGPSDNYNPCADYDRDGDVDIDDFLVFKAGFAITTVASDCE